MHNTMDDVRIGGWMGLLTFNEKDFNIHGAESYKQICNIYKSNILRIGTIFFIQQS